ncbi:MAG TPA: DHA2 family efflux MFS transporter permease subunit [Acidimicrobiia bacterium]|nr:DHA2 family efflux MFS transporter permease subunit [Acidimicrobiia bacterium]
MKEAPGLPPAVEHRDKWWVFGTVAAGVLLATIDGSIVNIALPTLVAEFGTTFAVVQWVALAYLLALAALSLGVGRLGDVIGKKKIYVVGMAAFTAASVLCGLAPGVGWLIAFRVLQALGATMILSLGAAILTEAFPAQERGRALGWIGTAVSVGVVTGPVVGGLLLASFSWRSIFLVNLPVGIVGTWLAWRHVPATPPHPGQRFDFLGASVLGGALLAFALGLTMAQNRGFADPVIIILLGMSVLLGGFFIRVERRHPHPMIDLRLFSNPLLTASVVTGYLTFVTVSAVFLLMPFYLENVLGLPIQQTGLVMAASPLALGIVAPIAGNLSDRLGVRGIALAGLIVLAVAYLRFTGLTVDLSIPAYLALAIPIGVGMGVFQSPNNVAIMSSVPPHYLGIGSGLLNITRLLGQITGAAALGSLWAARVRSHSGGTLPPGGATDAAAAAQVAGLHDTYLFAAALLGIATVIGWWAFGHDRTRTHLHPHPPVQP